MSHDYVLTVSLSSIANYLVYSKTLAFLAECTLLLAVYLLTVKQLLFYGYNVS